jgi:hypothetical protein
MLLSFFKALALKELRGKNARKKGSPAKMLQPLPNANNNSFMLVSGDTGVDKDESGSFSSAGKASSNISTGHLSCLARV